MITIYDCARFPAGCTKRLPESKEREDRTMKRMLALLLALVMVFSLCACGGSSSASGSAESAETPKVEEEVPISPEEEAYSAALALMEEGKYEEAIAAFTALDAYADSQTKLEECRAKLAEAKYDEASALMAEEKYAEAGAIFKELDYEDSGEKLEECRQKALYELTDVGDIITFGKYEQDRVKENGADPLTWRVLDKQDGKLLIITKKAHRRAAVSRHLLEAQPHQRLFERLLPQRLYAGGEGHDREDPGGAGSPSGRAGYGPGLLV